MTGKILPASGKTSPALDRVIEALRARGCDPRPSGAGFIGHCPGHDDRHESLTICEGADGRVLLKCHRADGCPTRDIVAALGLTMADLFVDDGRRSARGSVLATYVYTDENGAPLYRVERRPGKVFEQARADGRGGWVRGAGCMKGVRRVPYRLTDVLRAVAEGQLVVVVEGEKDAESLRQLGFVATTNAQGAGKWPREWGAAYFTGADVVIFPDNDEEGRKHARQVAESLHGHAARVRVVELPGLPEKGDVTDWVVAGGTADELARLIEAAPTWEGAPPSRAMLADRAPNREVPTRALLRAVVVVLKRYVVFSSDDQATAVALWVLMTYCFESFECVPYLWISSATKRAGKSRLFELLALVAHDPWYVTEPSEAVLFRKVHKDHPTLLVDECDATFGKDSKLTEGLRAIYNAGYRRGATVPRCVGQSHEVVDFEVYCPKAFAGLAGLPDTVIDRAIPVLLRRQAPHERRPGRFRIARVEREVAALREALRAWGEEHGNDLGRAEPQLPEALSDRAQDAWEPLLAIADLAGGPWPARARQAAVRLQGEVEEGDLGVLLLTHCRDAFESEVVVDGKITTADLLAHLVGRGDDSPWASWWAEDLAHDQTKRPASRLARLLKPFGIGPEQIWLGGAKHRGYERTRFEGAWERYCTPTIPVPDPTDLGDGRTVESWSAAQSGPAALEPKTPSDQDSTVLPTLGTVGTGRDTVGAPVENVGSLTTGGFDEFDDGLAVCCTCGRPTPRVDDRGEPWCLRCQADALAEAP